LEANRPNLLNMALNALKNYLALAASNEHLKVRAVTKYTPWYLQVGLHVMDPPSEHLIFTHCVLKPAPNRKHILGDVYPDFWRHPLVAHCNPPINHDRGAMAGSPPGSASEFVIVGRNFRCAGGSRLYVLVIVLTK